MNVRGRWPRAARHPHQGERGATAVEYGLILSLVIGVLLLVAFTSIGQWLLAVFGSTTSLL
jgi:Flp pilus assembly pilin Flp